MGEIRTPGDNLEADIRVEQPKKKQRRGGKRTCATCGEKGHFSGNTICRGYHADQTVIAGDGAQETTVTTTEDFFEVVNEENLSEDDEDVNMETDFMNQHVVYEISMKQIFCQHRLVKSKRFHRS
jgi:hypothetical protein